MEWSETAVKDSRAKRGLSCSRTKTPLRKRGLNINTMLGWRMGVVMALELAPEASKHPACCLHHGHPLEVTLLCWLHSRHPVLGQELSFSSTPQ